MQQIDPYCLPRFQILNTNECPEYGSQGTSGSLQSFNEQFFTLDSAPATEFVIYNSPSDISICSNRSPFSPQCSSQSYLSNAHHSSDNIYGSPLSGSSFVTERSEIDHILREMKVQLLGTDSDIDDGCVTSFNSMVPTGPSLSKYEKMLQMIPCQDLGRVFYVCAQAVEDARENIRDDAREDAEGWMEVLQKMVSVSGEPIQRLGAYMMEGLRARLLSSGSRIYKKLRCREITGPELMSYMHVLYEICPYYKFAYRSANVIIEEVMANEKHIHVIDFGIAQGSQWVFLIQALARRCGGPPSIRITGVDDEDSLFARGGGLHLVGKRLSEVAKSCGVPFEFNSAGISGCDIELENIRFRDSEALAVNFPYMLHHMPDESVDTVNHRDRLLRLVKGLSPKVVTLLEQESNTNTSSFLNRFAETLDYYLAMFESIDAGSTREDKKRISAEEHCVARDIVNIVACEGAERVERHEPFGKWRYRLAMAGFSPIRFSYTISSVIQDTLKDYSQNYKCEERDGALYLYWKNRAMCTSSAWR